MADRTLFFDALLQTQNLRAKSYVVHEPPGSGWACIELTARRLEDWFFARRWISVRNGRRLLFWLLDEVEGHGYRFHVARAQPPPGVGPEGEEWMHASEQWDALDPEERRIHAELFPLEDQLLRDGYDWDHADVWRDGVVLPRDPIGRVLEERDGIQYEWVRVPEEWTWRRFPIFNTVRTASASVATERLGSAA